MDWEGVEGKDSGGGGVLGVISTEYRESRASMQGMYGAIFFTYKDTSLELTT
jgi:hypothetical protein